MLYDRFWTKIVGDDRTWSKTPTIKTVHRGGSITSQIVVNVVVASANAYMNELSVMPIPMESISCPLPSASLPHLTDTRSVELIVCFSVFLVYVAWKRGLPRNSARFVLFRPIKSVLLISCVFWTYSRAGLVVAWWYSHTVLEEEGGGGRGGGRRWRKKFSSVPWPIGSSRRHVGRFSRDPLPVFAAGDPCEQFWHGQICQVLDVVHPAFPLPTTASPTL